MRVGTPTVLQTMGCDITITTWPDTVSINTHNKLLAWNLEAVAFTRLGETIPYTLGHFCHLLWKKAPNRDII